MCDMSKFKLASSGGTWLHLDSLYITSRDPQIPAPILFLNLFGLFFNQRWWCQERDEFNCSGAHFYSSSGFNSGFLSISIVKHRIYFHLSFGGWRMRSFKGFQDSQIGENSSVSLSVVEGAWPSPTYRGSERERVRHHTYSSIGLNERSSVKKLFAMRAREYYSLSMDIVYIHEIGPFCDNLWKFVNCHIQGHVAR